LSNILFGLEINASGGAQTVGQFKAMQQAIANLKKEATTFNAVAKALGITDDEARKLAQNLGKTADETLDLVAAMKDLKSLQVDAATRFQVLSKGANLTADQFEKLEKHLGTTNAELNDFQKLGGAIASAGVAAKIAEIGKDTLQTGLKFEGLQSTLETTLGSKAAADQVFGRLQTFAADTPNQLDEVVQAFISLKQRGIEPTNEVLTKFGDIAASQGKPLQQFIEAVLDATTGENERLKEFGIAAKTSGDKVTFSFQGINKTVEKTPQAIQGALLAFGALDGVTGGMAKKAATLGGQFSNLQDNTEALQNELFSLAQGPMIAVVTQANTAINYFRDLPAPLQLTVLGIAGVSGALVAAIAAVTAFNLANGEAIVTAGLQSAALVKDAIATQSLAGWKLIAAIATGKLTEAQIASMGAMAGMAVTAGLVVGALASIALAVDTFNKITESARETEKATANLEKSLASLTEIEKKHADEAGKAAANQSLEAAALERTQKQLGPIQNGLDVLRNLLNTISLGHLLKEFAKLDFVPEPLKNLLNALGNALPKVTTAAEESLREQAVAFEEQATKADEITGKVFTLFSKGAKKLTDNELKLYKSAVDEATASIKDHIPIDEQDSNLKANKLSLLAKSKTLIDAETAAREKSKKAIEGAAAAEQKAKEDAAKGKAAVLKSQQDSAKEKAQEQADARSRDRAQKAAEAQRSRQEQFDNNNRTKDRAFQDLKQQREDAFNTAQQSKAQAFQKNQQLDSEAFQTRQQTAQKAFEDKLKAANQATATAFTEAQRRASVAEQLAAAKTTEERQKILKESAAQVAQQQAIAKLNLADRPFNPDQILNLAKQITGANQGTVEGAKKISDAIAAIQSEQQKQQEAADQQKRVAFEAQLRADAKAFADQQKAEQDVFDQRKRDESKAFAENERAIADEWAQLQREVQKAFADNERAIQRASEDENRSIQKAFKDEQRALDLANAEAIKKILDSAKAKTPEGRRSGGSIAPGEPYLVGEEGPELIYPDRAGYVATARETAAMMAIPSVGIAAVPSVSINTRTLEAQSAKMVKLLGDANATLNKMAKTTPVVPPPPEFPKEKPIFENWGGLPL
jgi:hypothetical protein